MTRSSDRPVMVHKTYMNKREYWQIFISGYDFVTSENSTDVSPTFYPGDRIEIINMNSKHGVFPFGKNYGRIRITITDEVEGITPGHTAIFYKTSGFFYLFFAGLFGTLAVCVLLSVLGVI